MMNFLLKRSCSLLFFIQLSFISVYAIGSTTKQELDSLNKVAIGLSKSDEETSLKIALDVKERALDEGYMFGAAQASYVAGFSADRIGQKDKATIHFFECLRFLEDIKETSELSIYYSISSLICIGNVFYGHGHYEEAVKYYEDGLAVAHRHDKDKFIAWTNYLIGRTLKEDAKYVEAIDALFESSKYAERSDDFFRLSSINRQLGFIFKRIGDYEKSREHYFKIFEFRDKLKNFDVTAGQNCHNIANTYIEEANFEKAEEYLLKALEYKRSSNKPDNAFVTLMDLGELYYNYRHYDKSLQAYNDALALGIDVSSDPDEFKIFKQIAALYAAMGNSPKFISNNSQYTQYLEAYLNTSRELAEMDQKYNIQLVTQRYFELVENQKRIAAFKKYGGLALAGLLSLLIIVILFSRFRRTKLRKTLELELQETLKGMDFDL